MAATFCNPTSTAAGYNRAVCARTEYHARECIRLACLTTDKESNTTLVEMAREWMNVAIEAEGGTPIPPSTPASGSPDKS
jgi:hypothetical protein